MSKIKILRNTNKNPFLRKEKQMEVGVSIFLEKIVLNLNIHYMLVWKYKALIRQICFTASFLWLMLKKEAMVICQFRVMNDEL